MTWSAVETVLRRARERRVFSAVCAEIGTSDSVLWRWADGTLGFDTDAAVNHDTIFDLASLTKVLSTTSVAWSWCCRGVMDLATPVSDIVEEWRGGDRRAVTVRDLLEHASGLPAHREFYKQIHGADAYTRAIADEPLQYAPRSASVYSDLGFILAGVAVERLTGQPLDRLFEEWRQDAQHPGPLMYRPPAAWQSRIAKTEDDPWRGRVLQGEVHDENAAALGGVAGHAGLFGTAAAVGQAAQWWLALLGGAAMGLGASAHGMAQRFVEPSSVPGSSRAVGWDTMRPTSSCGTKLSARAIGHTGFTGTSLWIDPERDRYFVLLTNRVHPSRAGDAIQEVRRAFHEAAVLELRSR